MRKAAIAASVMLSLPLIGATAVAATDTGQVQQVTNGNNKSTVPVISGDGTSIVFHTLADDLAAGQGYSGIENLFVATPDDNPVGLDQFAIDAVFPDMSANGNWIVYTVPPPTGGNNQVWRYNTQTGDKLQITNGNADSGTFANLPGARVADNGTVVFQSLATNLTGNDPDATTNDNGWDIYYWNGSSTTKLSTGSIAHYLNPDIAANASVMTFNSQNGDNSDRRIFTATPAGVPSQRVAGNGRDDLPKLTDNGSTLVFRSDSTDFGVGTPVNTRNAYLWSSGGGVVQVTAHNDGTAITNPAISGNGGFVAYQRGGQIYRSVAATNGATIQVSANAGGPIDYASLDNDGSRITYAESIDGSVAGVEIMLWDANATTPPPPPVDPPGPGYCDFDDPILVKAPYAGSSGLDGRISRLYAAYFLRQPDTGGFKFWQDIIGSGNWTNVRAASFFSESQEFRDLYGDQLSNTEFIAQLYNNVFCREADQGGLEFWLGRMNNQGWTRGMVALGFSDSPEFRGRTQTS